MPYTPAADQTPVPQVAADRLEPQTSHDASGSVACCTVSDSWCSLPASFRTGAFRDGRGAGCQFAAAAGGMSGPARRSKDERPEAEEGIVGCSCRRLDRRSCSQAGTADSAAPAMSEEEGTLRARVGLIVPAASIRLAGSLAAGHWAPAGEDRSREGTGCCFVAEGSADDDLVAHASASVSRASRAASGHESSCVWELAVVEAGVGLGEGLACAGHARARIAALRGVGVLFCFGCVCGRCSPLRRARGRRG